MQCNLRSVVSLASKNTLKTNGAILGALNTRFYSATHDADLVVIGSGPGGYVGSIKAAQLGMKTINIEKYPTLGGTCLNVGCIPSKALLNHSYLYELVKHGLSERGIKVSNVELDLNKLMDAKEKCVKSLTGGIAQLFKKNKVKQLTGLGTIKSPNSVELTKADGGKELINTKNIMIATGSVVTPFPGIEVDQKVVINSDGALSLRRLPKHMILIGCGIIGVELSAAWARLGAKVTAVDVNKTILPFYMDPDIVKAYKGVIEKYGMKFKMSTKINAIKRDGDTIKMEVENVKGGGKEEMTADCLFVAIGRKAFTANLGLENVNIKVDKKGSIPVNKKYQTSVPNIYAIGDCIPGPQLAHKAEVEGESAVEGMKGHTNYVNYDTLPSIMFSHPEIAWIGKSVHMLEADKIKCVVGKFPFAANSRAKADLYPFGFVKVICAKDTGRILGVHVIGSSASEIISEAGLAMEYGGSAEDVARACHAHPTHSEAFREACIAAAYGKAINM